MKLELKKDNYIISQNLSDAMDKALNNRQGILLLHNRRGYSLICQCNECNGGFGQRMKDSMQDVSDR